MVWTLPAWGFTPLKRLALMKKELSAVSLDHKQWIVRGVRGQHVLSYAPSGTRGDAWPHPMPSGMVTYCQTRDLSHPIIITRWVHALLGLIHHALPITYSLTWSVCSKLPPSTRNATFRKTLLLTGAYPFFHLVSPWVCKNMWKNAWNIDINKRQTYHFVKTYEANLYEW